MSVNLYVHFDRKVADVDPHERDHVVAANLEKLDRYAERRGLVPLGSFVSYSGQDVAEMADDSDDSDEDGSVDLDADPQWFDAHDLQHAVEALVAAVVDEPPSYIDQAGRTAELLGDLNSIARLTRLAVEAKVKVRLTIRE